MNGIVIIDKPEGWSSNDVVSKLKGVRHTRRVGHGDWTLWRISATFPAAGGRPLLLSSLLGVV